MNMNVLQTSEYYKINLKEKYVRFGMKTFQVNKKTFFKILYQLHYDTLQIYRCDQIEEFMSHQYAFYRNMRNQTAEDTEMTEEKIDLTILILCKKTKTTKHQMDKTNDFCVYVPYSDLNKWILSTIFLNDNTLNFLKNQEFPFYLKREYNEIRNRINIYRQFYFEELNHLDQSQTLLFSSVCLYFIGHRACNDIDIMGQYLSEEAKLKLMALRETHQRVYSTDAITSTPNLAHFMDIAIRDTPTYPHYWSEWLNNWAMHYGAKYWEEIMGNGRFHCYFLGMKMTTIECDLIRRGLRNRPNAIADLISFKRRYPMYAVFVPSPPENEIEYIKIDDKISEEEIVQLLSNEENTLNENLGEIVVRKPFDTDRFLKTILNRLHDRYRMDKMTLEDVCSEVGVQYKTIEQQQQQQRPLNLKRSNEKEITIGSILRNAEHTASNSTSTSETPKEIVLNSGRKTKPIPKKKEKN